MKAVLVFCEGRHDVVFAQRSLGAHGACKWVDTPIGKLPSPFGCNAVAKKGFIAKRLERNALEDRVVKATAHPPPPCFESIVQSTATGTIYFMIRAQGKTQPGPVVDLLQALDNTIDQPPNTFEVSEYAAAFIFDANGEGVTGTLEEFYNRYGGHFGDLSKLKHGEWVTDTTVPVGCFVFHKNARDPTGTIEDHLAPMVKQAWPDKFDEANRFVEDKRDGNDKVSSSEAERLKAIITAAGQFNHPGDPMSIIIDRNGLPHAEFEKAQTSAELARFLMQIPW